MKHADTIAPTALDALEAAARAAQKHENEYRAEAAREIARLERERVFAFRRVRLVRLLCEAAARCEADKGGHGSKLASGAAAVAQRHAVAAEFGWDEEDARHKPVLDRIAGIGAHAGEDAGALQARLADFEAWYRSATGEPFYALFDVYVPEAPLVDF